MKTITLIIFTALLASANSVTVQFIGTSGILDGSDDVLPYFISINGGPTISADCYDFLDSITVGESWTANEFTLPEVLISGQYAGQPNAATDYKLAGILSTLTTTTPQQQIDLQQDLWDLFDPGAFMADAGMIVDMSTAAAEMPTFNFSGIEYLEGVPGTSPGVQAFVISPLAASPPAPEPSAIFLMGIGLVGIFAVRRQPQQ